MPAASHRPVPGAPRRHRMLRPRPGSPRPGPGHHHPPAVHHRRVLPVRRRGRTARSLPGRPCPPPPARLRVARHRAGPQRARRAAGRGRARPACRARADLAAGPQRAAGLRSHRRRHRGPGRRARAPDAGDHPQGRQGRHHPAGAAHRPGDRPGHRRAQRRTDLPGRRWPRLDRHGAGRIVRRVARRAGIAKPVGPHTLRHAFITAALDAGVSLRDVQEAASHADPRTSQVAPARCRAGGPFRTGQAGFPRITASGKPSGVAVDALVLRAGAFEHEAWVRCWSSGITPGPCTMFPLRVAVRTVFSHCSHSCGDWGGWSACSRKSPQTAHRPPCCPEQPEAYGVQRGELLGVAAGPVLIQGRVIGDALPFTITCRSILRPGEFRQVGAGCLVTKDPPVSPGGVERRPK